MKPNKPPKKLYTCGGSLLEAKRILRQGGIEALAAYAAKHNWPTRFAVYPHPGLIAAPICYDEEARFGQKGGYVIRDRDSGKVAEAGFKSASECYDRLEELRAPQPVNV